MKRSATPVLTLLVWIAAGAAVNAGWRVPAKSYGDDAKIKREIHDENVYPQYKKWIDIAKQTPTSYSGTVYFEGKPRAGIRVTDGLVFVTTDVNGHYRIEVGFDAMTPYLPARNIYVCWPEGTWPVKDKDTGRSLWWKRLMDVRKTPDKVDFFLEKRVVQPPLVMAYGTDPHDSLENYHNWIMPQEIVQGGNRVHIGMLLGDLMYSKLSKSDVIFSHIENYIRDFPVPYINVMGNHETPQPLFGPHPLGGNGGVTKYLGPIRWSFDIAGVHVVSLNYDLVNEQALQWLEADFDNVPPETPIYLFTHMWWEDLGAFAEHYQNLRFVMSGHSHRTLFCGKQGNAEFWTITNYYRLLYIDGWDWDFVDRKVGESPLYNYHVHSLGSGRTSVVSNVTVSADSVALSGFRTGANDGDAPADSTDPFGTGVQYDVAFSATPTGKNPATRFGVRIINERGYVFTFSYDVPSKTLHMAGRDTYFSPEPVEATMPRGHYSKPVREAMWAIRTFELVDPDEREPVSREEYEQALATVKTYEEVDREKMGVWRKQSALEKTVSFEINVCPGRIQTFVNDRVACIQFWRIGKAVRIEYFAEGGEATFHKVQVFEDGAGYHWKEFDRPVLNQLFD